MKIDVLSLFPDMIKASMSDSILKRAIEQNILDINFHQIRDYSEDKHNRVDDTTYGGGSGLVMKAAVLDKALSSIISDKKTYTIYFSPRGNKLQQKKVEELAKIEHIVMICGHYEGIDQRIIDKYVDEELSIGDYVLTGGELPCAVTIDAISRYLDGVLGTSASLEEESFTNNLLEYPHYTKPSDYKGDKVPQVLLSGNHQNIEEWRYKESLQLTYDRRKDLFYTHILDILKIGDKNELKKLAAAIKEMEF